MTVESRNTQNIVDDKYQGLKSTFQKTKAKTTAALAAALEIHSEFPDQVDKDLTQALKMAFIADMQTILGL